MVHEQTSINPVSIRIVRVGIIVLSHPVAWVQLFFLVPSLGVPERWLYQGSVLIVVLFVLGVFTECSSRRMVQGSLWLIRLGIVLLLGQASSSNITLESTLLCALLFEAGVRFPLRGSLLPAGIALLTSGIAQSTRTVWNGVVLVGPGVERVISLLVVGTFVYTLSALFRSVYLQRHEEREQRWRVTASNTELARVNMVLQKQIVHLESDLLKRERYRISRELHDTVGYALVNQITMMEAAVRVAPYGSEELIATIEAARTNAQQGLNEVRRAIYELRSEHDELRMNLNGLQRLVRAFAKTEISITLNTGNMLESYPREYISIFYRIVQEGITNSLRHGGANVITIRFWAAEREFSISVSDNGCGCSHISPGIGLQGLTERLAMLHGYLVAESTPYGFELRVRIPRPEYRDSVAEVPVELTEAETRVVGG